MESHYNTILQYFINYVTSNFCSFSSLEMSVKLWLFELIIHPMLQKISNV